MTSAAVYGTGSWGTAFASVLAGPPVDLSEYYGQEPTADVLRAATDTIMAAVTELLAEVRGEPVPARAYDTGTDQPHAADQPRPVAERPVAEEESK